MAKSTVFKSPLCSHTFPVAQLTSYATVTCACGYSFNSQIALSYLDETDKVETAKEWLANAQVVVEGIRKRLIALAKVNQLESPEGTAQASPEQVSRLTVPVESPAASPAPTSAATVVTQPPRKVTPPAPTKPQRAPLSPRAILLIVAGTLTLIGVSAGLATTWNILPDWAKAAVVLFLVVAAGFGAIKSRNFLRALANFLAILSSSLLLLGLYAEALLNPALQSASATDPSRSLYVPICLLVVAAISAWAGKKFQLNGWLFLPPMGVAVASALISLGFIPRIGFDATANLPLATNGTWQLVGISIGGLLTAYSGRFSKITVTSFTKPTSEQEFALLEINREANAGRQIIRLSYLAALAQLTIIGGMIAFVSLSGHRPDYLGLLALGALWIFGAWFLENRGGSFTSTGSVNGKVIWGAWILGFGSLGVTAGTWFTQFDSPLKENFLSAIIAGVIGGLFALSQNFVPWLRSYPIAKSVSRAASWVVWGGWLVTTSNLSLANKHQISVLVLFLIMISATWFAVRALEKSGVFQIHAIVPAAAAAVLWAFASQASVGSSANQLVLGHAVHLIFASTLLAVIGYLTLRLNLRSGSNFSAVGSWTMSLANILVAAGVILIPGPGAVASPVLLSGSANDLWALFAAALILSASRLATTGTELVKGDRTVKNMALIGSVSLLALPLVQLGISSTVGTLSDLKPVLIAVSMIELAIVAGYAAWQRDNRFGLSVLPFGALLSIAVGNWTFGQSVPAIGTSLIAIPMAIFAVITFGTLILAKTRLTDPQNTIASSAVILLAVVLLIQQLVVFADLQPTNDGQLNATVTAATLIVFGGLSLFGFRSKLIEKLPGGLLVTEGFGWVSLVFSLVSTIQATHTSQAHYRLTCALLAITVITCARARLKPGIVVQNLAFWTGFATIALGIQSSAIAMGARETNLGTYLLSQIGFVALILTLGWNWVLARLAGISQPSAEEHKVPITQLEGAIYLALGFGLTGLAFLTLPPVSPQSRGLVLLAEPATFQWQTIGTGTLALALLLWIRLVAVKRKQLLNSQFRPILATWALTIVSLALHWSEQNWWLVALELAVLATAMFLDGFFSHDSKAIPIGFAASVLGGWVLASQAFYQWHFPLSQLFNFAAIISFVIATWLLNRNPKGFNLDAWSIVLPIVSGISVLIGLSYRFIFFAHDAQKIGDWLLEAEWLIALALAVAYLFISRDPVLENLGKAQRSALASASLSWLLAWPIVLTSSMNISANAARLMLFSALSIAALLVFATRYKPKWAMLLGYIVALPFALGFDQLTRSAFGWKLDGPEFISAALTAVAVTCSVLYQRTFGKPKTTDYSWGLPVLFASLPSTVLTIATSTTPISSQTDSQIWRFVLVNVLAAAVLVTGIRIGKRGLVWPTTATLLIGLVPNLYYRIDDAFPDVRVQNEMKALLFATTAYVLIYLLRKTQKLAVPSVVAVGIPAVISISVLFLDTLGALQQNQLEANDWIRFLVLIVIGTAFLTLGAIRKMAGLFYPGIVAVLVAAIPYAWQKTNYGSWVVLLLLAGLIVWVAIRLERFTGWLKELK